MENKNNIDSGCYDVLIVGAGFAGLYQLHHLRKKGLRVKVIEAGNDIGGVWYWNCYPGARVDSIGAIYQFSDPELWKDWNYSEKFPQWDEVRAYFDHVDSKWDLRKDCQFDTRVTDAIFDEETSRWTVTTSDGQQQSCRYFVLCTGFAAKPVIPQIPGKEDFKGVAHHTALWPQDGLDFTGKRVAVIGVGASGVQVIQEATKTVAKLDIFQRTPNLTIPMRQHKISAEDNQLHKDKYPELFEMRKKSFAGFEFDFIPKSALEVSDEERRETYEEIWAQGAFNWWLGVFNDVLTNREANQTQYEFWRDQTRKRIKDPALYEKLAPTIPPHPYGVKRPCLEQNFYECFNEPNVNLIDVKETPIQCITETGIRFGDTEQEYDIIVYATGFDAVSGGLTAINIIGTDGRTLRERWQEGTCAYLGMAVDKFPNMAFLYGPQSPSGFCNGPTCAEVQGEWLVEFLEYLDHNRIHRFETDTESVGKWRDRCMEMANQTLFLEANSWYVGANIPGKPRELLAYPGGLPDYIAQISNVKEAGYAGFELQSVSVKHAAVN